MILQQQPQQSSTNTRKIQPEKYNQKNTTRKIQPDKYNQKNTTKQRQPKSTREIYRESTIKFIPEKLNQRKQNTSQLDHYGQTKEPQKVNQRI